MPSYWQEVYPRVGGGTCGIGAGLWLGPGLSPRGRGNPARAKARHRDGSAVADGRYQEGGIGDAAGGNAANPHGPEGYPAGVLLLDRVGPNPRTSRPSATIPGSSPDPRPSRSPGLSPRGRGNRRGGDEAPGRPRSIPAWAGEPPVRLAMRARRRVYPRVGGGTAGAILEGETLYGLSPRGRGNQGRPVGRDHGVGSIPAWAGEPSALRSFAASCRVYPRVGGGTANRALPEAKRSGLSPRGRGNRRWFPRHPSSVRSIPAGAGGTIASGDLLPARKGLSPRGRGNLAATERRVGIRRSIPAWAGEPSTPAAGGPDRPQLGLSPRGRGNPIGSRRQGASIGSIPAWAGEPGKRMLYRWLVKGLSPRGRGNREVQPAALERSGSIPAWAGEPIGRFIRRSLFEVYPRVGGGTTQR